MQAIRMLLALLYWSDVQWSLRNGSVTDPDDNIWNNTYLRLVNHARISPTAHYTGYVWFAHGQSHEVFATKTGKRLTDRCAART